MVKKTFIINGVTRNILVDENETLATFLRERLLLTGCKIGCGEGHCGACNVIVNGKVTRSCLTKLGKIKDGAEITTIEGIGTLSDLHPLQVAWMAHGCAQCGFCSPGFIMTSKVLLDNNPSPTREEVRDWFQKNRNLCRCTGYKPLVDAVMDAAREAGARGGTVLHGKGTGSKDAEKFFRVSIAQEKELILIVAKSDEKAAIMKSIVTNAGVNTEAGAVVISLPVSEVAGFGVLTKSEE